MATTRSLCDICSPKQWKTISTDMLTDEGYPVYGANGVIGFYPEYNHKEPTLLITCRGATCGTLNICKPYSYVNGNAMSLDNLSEDVDIKYLYYFLLNRGFDDVITGSAQPQIVRKSLQKVSVTYPDLEKQVEIVSTFERISMLINLRKEQLAKLDELVKARFVEMFGGIHDSSLYPYTTIGSFTTVMSGGTPDRRTSEYWQDGTIRWVKTTELQNCVITDTEEKITPQGMDNSSAKLIPANSILIAMYGQGKTRGMTGYIAVECTTNQACACILPSVGVNQKYLWEYMILSYERLRDMAKGGNQPNLNAGIIKSFPVLMPPLDLQDQFAFFAEQTNKSKLTIQASLDKLEVMKKALMQEYFG